MIVESRQAQRNPRRRGVKYVSRRQGARILDRQARRYLGMSGEEFVRKYHAGELENSHRPEVIRISMLVPLAER